MTRGLLAAAVLVLLVTAGGAGAESYCWKYGDGEGVYSFSKTDASYGTALFYSGMNDSLWAHGRSFYFKYYITVSNPSACIRVESCSVYSPPNVCSRYKCPGTACAHQGDTFYSGSGYCSGSKYHQQAAVGIRDSGYWGGPKSAISGSIIINWTAFDEYIISGTTSCVSDTSIWIHNGTGYVQLNSTLASSYSFKILDGYSYRLLFDGAYYDFICTGNEVFNYDACLFVYGYTCGIDNIALYKDDGGWVMEDTELQSGHAEDYEMAIEDGESYWLRFFDRGYICHNRYFTCTGEHVLINYDQCEYIYSIIKGAPPYIVYFWTGYDYNMVLFKDEHGNFIENSKVAIYDNTDSAYIQKWTDTSDGYALLGTRFDTDHDVMIMLRTFDGIFTLDTTYPANGTAAAGDENITTTNWTIPIKYNLDIYPVDQASVPLLDVFCGLAEYTPLDPLSFWGFSMSGSQHVPVTNCSGFSMCDIIAEKGGYETYEETALNWTSKSALTKDYRHTATLTKE